MSERMHDFVESITYHTFNTKLSSLVYFCPQSVLLYKCSFQIIKHYIPFTCTYHRVRNFSHNMHQFVHLMLSPSFSLFLCHFPRLQFVELCNSYVSVYVIKCITVYDVLSLLLALKTYF